MPDSTDDRQELLDRYRGLRVADVRDGLDWLMMHPYGSLSPDIRPLFRVRTCGIARTARYLPYQGEIPPMTPDAYTEWAGWYYNTVCPYPWMADIQDGDFIVIDQSGANVGLMGSNNSLAGLAKGARGYVTNGGVRDTDELIREQVPFWSRLCSQSTVHGRLQFDAQDVPVSVGGVVVFPGDMVVADGDGVIVVPRRLAVAVAEHAHRELASDKQSRRQLYEQLGMPLDDTVL